MGFTIFRRRILCYLLIILVTGLLLISCRSSGTMSAPAVTEQPVKIPLTTPATSSSPDAAGLYAANCAVCHGENRYGMINLGGSLTPESLAGRSDIVIKEVISGGMPYTAMPALKDRLSLEEINAIVQFIKYTSP